MRKQHKDFPSVLAEVRTKRPQVKPSANFIAQLEIWDEVQYRIWEDEAKTIPKKEHAEFLEKRAALLKAKGLTGGSLVDRWTFQTYEWGGAVVQVGS
jgi:dual specificity phosphatase 12